LNNARKYFQNASQLPTMPEVASQLLQTFGKEDINMQEVAALIGKDGSLSAKVLRLGNSAHYRPAQDVSTIKDAALVLGFFTLRDLTLTACVVGAFPDVKGLDRNRFWKHSLSTANHAKVLARLMQLDADTAYLAGLMLRTGQILMAMQEPDLIADEETHILEPDSRFSLETSRFGCTHAQVTAELARHWHFPAHLAQALEHVSDPLAARPFSLLAATLRMSQVLADAQEMDLNPAQALLNAQPDLIEHLHLDVEWLTQKLSEAPEIQNAQEGMLV
jgi:HD-like signal output (HDOD) protein